MLIEGLFSPVFLMDLMQQIQDKIDKLYPNEEKQERYLSIWKNMENKQGRDFEIRYWSSNIWIADTLSQLEHELLFKIAIDLGVSIPRLIYSVPVITGLIESNYVSAYDSFEKALKSLYSDPDMAVGLANSALESIVSEMLLNRDKKDLVAKNTLYDLTQNLLKEIDLYPNKGQLSNKMKQIGSSLLNIVKNIESIRSDNTRVHGSKPDGYILKSPACSEFIINTVATIGLLLMRLQGLESKKESSSKSSNDIIKLDDKIPF